MIRLPVVLALMLLACLTQLSPAAAGGLNVRDDAGVLSASEEQAIRGIATNASFSVYVWTTKGGYTGNKAGFVSAADALVTNNNTVVVAVDTVDKFSHVAARNARLTAAATSAAKTTADSSFGKAQWAGGIEAALNSLTSSVGTTQSTGTSGTASNGTAAKSSSPLAALLPLLIVGALIVGVIALVRSRRRRAIVGPQDAPAAYGPGGPGGPGNAGYGPGSAGYGPGNAGYGPGNAGYGGGYGGGPGYNRGGGMGGMLAGGALGGIGGGLLGYELGKEAGEREGDRGDGQYAGSDQGQDQGGFVESDQGQGGADWGGDGGGSAGDFGGGDFGGGGDGGGGGSDF